jgi:hypothetical protein
MTQYIVFKNNDLNDLTGVEKIIVHYTIKRFSPYFCFAVIGKLHYSLLEIDAI